MKELEIMIAGMVFVALNDHPIFKEIKNMGYPDPGATNVIEFAVDVDGPTFKDKKFSVTVNEIKS